MLPGFLPQSTPPAPPPAGGDLPAASGADAADAAAAGEAFTAALDSACDAQSACSDIAEGCAAAEKPAAATSPGLAAWLLALGLRGDVASDAPATHQASQTAGEDVTVPVPGDDDEANEDVSLADAADAADVSAAVAAPVIEVVQAAEAMPVTSTSIEPPPEEHAADTVGRAGSDRSATGFEAARASDGRSAPDAAARADVSGGNEASRDALEDVDRESESRRASSRSDAAPEALAAKAEGAAGRVENGPVTAESPSGADTEYQASSSADRPHTSDVRRTTTLRSQAAPGSAPSATSAQQGAVATPVDTGTASTAPTDASSATPSDATVAASAPAADGRPMARKADAPSDVDRQARTQPAAAAASAPQGGASPHDSSRQNQDAEFPGRHRGLDVAVARTAATAMLTLVAGPDGALRLTPAAMAAPVLAPILPQDQIANIDQLVQTMRVMVKDQVTEATVHLRPEHFGEVSIQVRMEGKSVSAFIHTESSQVRDWLLGQEGTLRAGLSEQGLQLERLVVQRDGRQDRREANQQQPERRRQRQRPQDESQQTFEVTV